MRPTGDFHSFIKHDLQAIETQAIQCQRCTIKVKSCYNPLRLGTVIVLVSSGIDFCKYSTSV